MKEPDGKIISYKTFAIVWAALVALTLVSAGVYGMGPRRFGCAIAFGIAALKASLVLLFFMQLKYEKGFLRLMPAIAVAAAAVVIALVWSDILYRV